MLFWFLHNKKHYLKLIIITCRKASLLILTGLFVDLWFFALWIGEKPWTHLFQIQPLSQRLVQIWGFGAKTPKILTLHAQLLCSVGEYPSHNFLEMCIISADIRS